MSVGQRGRRDQSPTSLFEVTLLKDISTLSMITFDCFQHLSTLSSWEAHFVDHLTQSIVEKMAYFAPFYRRTFPNVTFWKNLFLGSLVTLFHITSFSCVKYKPSFHFDDPPFIYDISSMTLTLLFWYLFDFFSSFQAKH